MKKLCPLHRMTQRPSTVPFITPNSIPPNGNFYNANSAYWALKGATSGGGGGGGGTVTANALEVYDSTSTLQALQTFEGAPANYELNIQDNTAPGATAPVLVFTPIGSNAPHTDYQAQIQSLQVRPSGQTLDALIAIQNNPAPPTTSSRYEMLVPTSDPVGPAGVGSLLTTSIQGGTPTQINFISPNGQHTHLTTNNFQSNVLITGTLTQNGAATFNSNVTFTVPPTGIAVPGSFPVLANFATGLNNPDIRYNSVSVVATLSYPTALSVWDVIFRVAGGTYATPNGQPVNAFFFLGPTGQTTLGPNVANSLTQYATSITNGNTANMTSGARLTYAIPSGTPGLTALNLYCYHDGGAGGSAQSDVNILGGTFYTQVL